LCHDRRGKRRCWDLPSVRVSVAWAGGCTVGPARAWFWAGAGAEEMGVWVVDGGVRVGYLRAAAPADLAALEDEEPIVRGLRGGVWGVEKSYGWCDGGDVVFEIRDSRFEMSLLGITAAHCVITCLSSMHMQVNVEQGMCQTRVHADVTKVRLPVNSLYAHAAFANPTSVPCS
jgi:hypothetical protein